MNKSQNKNKNSKQKKKYRLERYLRFCDPFIRESLKPRLDLDLHCPRRCPAIFYCDSRQLASHDCSQGFAHSLVHDGALQCCGASELYH